MGSASKDRLVSKSLPCVVAILLLQAQAAAPLEAQISEYQVKAAFLFNFAKFVDWPAAVVADQTQPFTIGIIGKNPFGDILEQTIGGKTLNNKSMTLKQCSSPEELFSCHILFMGKLEKKLMRLLIEKIGNAHILTVSEVEGFIQMGGIINFVIIDNKVRFEINNAAAERSGLKISAQLLKVATNVCTTMQSEGN